MSDQFPVPAPSTVADQPGPRVVVVADGPHDRERAWQLAGRLNLACADIAPENTDIVLHVRNYRLALSPTGPRAFGEVSADFRGFVRPVGKRRQPIFRAIGLTDPLPTIVDATAGLGRDAFFLASLGYRVTAIERSPIVAELLLNGLDRARTIPRLAEVIDQHLTFIVGDARDVLPRTSI